MVRMALASSHRPSDEILRQLQAANQVGSRSFAVTSHVIPGFFCENIISLRGGWWRGASAIFVLIGVTKEGTSWRFNCFSLPSNCGGKRGFIKTKNKLTQGIFWTAASAWFLNTQSLKNTPWTALSYANNPEPSQRYTMIYPLNLSTGTTTTGPEGSLEDRG